MAKSNFLSQVFGKVPKFFMHLRAAREKNFLGSRMPVIEIIGVIKEPQHYLISAKLPGKLKPLEFTFEQDGRFVYHSRSGKFLLDSPQQKILHNKFVRYIKKSSPYFNA